MSHEQFPPSLSSATIAAYFLFGLEAGLFPDHCAKEWAFDLIDAQDHPPIEVIEVATATRREDVFSTLAALIPGGDYALAGRWLLAYIRTELLANRLPIGRALSKAMQVASSTSLPKDVYYAFDTLEDELYLAETGAYGAVADVTRDTLAALASHAASPASAT